MLTLNGYDALRIVDAANLALQPVVALVPSRSMLGPSGSTPPEMPARTREIGQLDW